MKVFLWIKWIYWNFHICSLRNTVPPFLNVSCSTNQMFIVQFLTLTLCGCTNVHIFFSASAMQTWINHVSLFSLLSYDKYYNIYIHYDLKQFGSLWVTRYSKMLWFTLRELTCSHKSTPTIAIVSVSIMRASTGIKTRSLMWQTNNECISNSNAQRVEGLRRILTVQRSDETISRKSSSSYSYQLIIVATGGSYSSEKRWPLGVKKCSWRP